MENNLSSSQVALGDDPLNAFSRKEEVKEEVPMNEAEVQVHPEQEARNLEEIKTVESVIERTRKSL
jgi:hypothetical protein